jgi:hypothetical protein
MWSPRPTTLATALLLAGSALGAPAVARAQPTGPVPAVPVPAGRRQMIGFVRDPKGGPLEGVTVQVHGERITTDRRGAFQFLTAAVDTASITLRRLGFEPIDAFISARNGMWDTVVVQMDAALTTLEEVRVSDNYMSRAGGLRGYGERKERGLGQFVERSEILDRGSQKLTDILRAKKGVQIVRGRLRFAAFGGRTVCQPNVYLDGTKAPGMEVDEVNAQAVEAIELYPNLSTIPLEFQSVGSQTAPCGTVVIWTRVPNSKGR